jgi:hypothetical protein
MASRQSGDARRPVAAAFDVFGGWCFVDGEVALELKRGQSRLAGHDATNVKNQDLTRTRGYPEDAAVKGPDQAEEKWR